MVSFNSPTHKLSNDTPYAYSTANNEIKIFRAIRGQSIRGHIGGQEGQTAQNMVPFNSPTHKLSNDTPHAYSFTENQNFNFWVRSRLRLILEARWYFQWAYPCSWWFYYRRITTVPSHFVTALLI